MIRKTADEWERFRSNIPDATLVRKFDRALSAVEDAEYDLDEAKSIRSRAARRLNRIVLRIQAELRDAPKTRPDTRREPPIIDPPPTTPHTMADAPERIEPPTLPEPDVLVYADGRYRIPGDLTLKFYSGTPRDAYAAVEAKLTRPRRIVLGIYGNVGMVGLGHAYSIYGDDQFNAKGDWKIDVAFVGMGASAAVGPVFLGSREQDAGKFSVCDSAHFKSIGINGDSGTYAFRQHGYCRDFTFEDVWIVRHPNMAGMDVPYISAFMLHKDWDSMTLKGYQPRGMKLGEHVAYLKGGGFTQLLDNNLFGGRRTGFQDRSHGRDSDGQISPSRHGDFVADGNWADGFGFNHAEASGGQWMTVWSSLESKVRISNNRCTDARYGCLGISKGVASSNPYLTHDGLSHSNVYIFGNEFENKRAQRSCVSLADARAIHMGAGNKFTGPRFGAHTMVFGSQWGWKHAGAQVPNTWWYYGREAIPTWPVHQYMPATDSFHEMDEMSHMLHLVSAGGAR